MDSTILWLLAAFLLFSLCTCRDHKQNPSGTVIFEDKNLNFSWKISSTKKEKTIRFKVNAVIHKSGWFLIGFQPQKGETPKRFTETRGDAFVVWKKTVTNGSKNVWKVTDCNTFNKGNLQKDQKQNYHLPSKLLNTMYDSERGMLTAIVWRKLKTEDEKEDVIIKPGSMFVFASYGNEDSSKKWQNELKIIRDDTQDVFRNAFNIDFFEGNSLKTKKGGRDFVKYAENLAEQHWIGLVVGLSAFLTILITCTVYCIAKKGSGRLKNKHVSMSFHKDRSEYDDEAKVAFLQSEET